MPDFKGNNQRQKAIFLKWELDSEGRKRTRKDAKGQGRWGWVSVPELRKKKGWWQTSDRGLLQPWSLFWDGRAHLSRMEEPAQNRPNTAPDGQRKEINIKPNSGVLIYNVMTTQSQ